MPPSLSFSKLYIQSYPHPLTLPLALIVLYLYICVTLNPPVLMLIILFLLPTLLCLLLSFVFCLQEQLDVALSKTCKHFDVLHYTKVQKAYTLLGKTQVSGLTSLFLLWNVEICLNEIAPSILPCCLFPLVWHSRSESQTILLDFLFLLFCWFNSWLTVTFNGFAKLSSMWTLTPVFHPFSEVQAWVIGLFLNI